MSRNEGFDSSCIFSPLCYAGCYTSTSSKNRQREALSVFVGGKAYKKLQVAGVELREGASYKSRHLLEVNIVACHES